MHFQNVFPNNNNNNNDGPGLPLTTGVIDYKDLFLVLFLKLH